MSELSNIDRVEMIMPIRLSWIDKRLIEFGGSLDMLLDAIDRVPWDAHRDGQSKGGWSADFDWVFSQSQRLIQCLETKTDYRKESKTDERFDGSKAKKSNRTQSAVIARHDAILEAVERRKG